MDAIVNEYLGLTYLMTALVGLCVGSFLNVQIYRLPLGLSQWEPSHCPKCNMYIKWYDNIPVLSYTFLRGKCRGCKTHISFRYTFVEILNCLLWVACLYKFLDIGFWYACCMMVASSALVTVFFVDLEHMLIHDALTLFVALAGVGSIFAADVMPWYENVIGCLVWGGAFAAVYFVAKSVYKREAMGTGDIFLMAALGLLLGWKCTFIVLLVSSIVGSIVLLTLAKIKKEQGKEYPFGPFIVFGAFVAMFFGDAVIDFYLGMFV